VEIALSSLALTILTKCPKLGDFVFANRSGRHPFAASGAAKADIDRRIAGLCLSQDVPVPTHWTFHDLRRTAATGLSQIGTSRFITSRILNHRDAETTSIYDRHTHDEAKALALEAWAQKLRSIVESPPDNVAEFKRAAN
jgi:integrase